MLRRAAVCSTLIGTFALGPLAGCENLPGGSKYRGGYSRAPLPADAPGVSDTPGVGALADGMLGAGGGYLIGASRDNLAAGKREEARRASDRAVRNPAKREDAARAKTADLNEDGFVTIDEVVAMQQANLSDTEILDRLRDTKQLFELTPQQQNQLRDRNVGDKVISAIPGLNRGPETRQGG